MQKKDSRMVHDDVREKYLQLKYDQNSLDMQSTFSIFTWIVCEIHSC